MPVTMYEVVYLWFEVLAYSKPTQKYGFGYFILWSKEQQYFPQIKSHIRIGLMVMRALPVGV